MRNPSVRGRQFGKLPEWPNGADCKSAGVRLRWFESITSHEKKSRLELQDPDDARQSGIGAGEADSDTVCFCGSSSVDRASAFQAEGREFEPRLPLQTQTRVIRMTPAGVAGTFVSPACSAK